MRPLLRLLARRYAAWTMTWVVVVSVVVVATVPSYVSTYPDQAARLAAVELAQNNGATTLLYGLLPGTGSPAQLFGWEIGAFVTLLVAVLGLLLAVRLTRGAEQEGTVEIVRAAGLGRLAPLSATFVVLVAVSALLGLASAAGVGFRAGQVDGIDWPGSLAFGSVVALTFMLIALVTVVAAQLLPTAWSARVAGALVVAGSFAVRAAADTQHQAWLNWVTPLGLRATVQPFTANRLLPLVVASVVAILVAAVAAVLEHFREFGGSFVRASTISVQRARVSSPIGLAWHLGRATTAWWVAGIAVGGALFTAMGSSVVETARQGGLSGGFLKAQLGNGDPVSAYFGYIASLVAMIVVTFGALAIIEAATEERRGPGEYLRATGVSAARALAGHLGVGLIGSALALVAAAVLVAVVAPHAVSGGGVSGEAFRQVLGEWSGVLVLVGPVVLCAGWAPRLVWLSWFPIAAAVVLALLGRLVGLPQAVIDLGPFSPDHGVLVTLVRLTIFGLTVGLGMWAAGRRDVRLG